ncbi:S1C family serine protease [Candidatus Mycobacterium methanotrophicum]|uniref:S1C family serine protease n=1 Tax=Candidatus Mycobacterium methanotrophicum TaxID=2943498 RepID=A0ABY4QL37_9MYCO|nr:trypsin-like peptidase domain-containing protein [Candidatus Mycobacterium methanotrophicum]UQX10927.1 S1C family serine protease [Candidatus Mycobacterium methanotrophicum]
MSESHRRRPRRSLWLLSPMAVAGLALATAPAQASPVTPPAPRDALAAVGQVGPTIVDIDAQLGYQSAVGSGTGIVIGPSTVLTNNHVIAGATSLTVRSIGNGQTFPATVIGFDRSHDIAVLQLGGGGLQPANIGNSDTVTVGEPIVSLGNAGGAGGAPSAVDGRVLALNQTVSASDSLTGSAETLDRLIQVDAAIRPGDSGGPTVNAANQVIGMNTAASDNYHLGRGQGFAIPINEAMAIAGQIQGGGSPTVHIGPTAFLGVGVNDAPGGAGAVVKQVIPTGPAAGAGLAPGDVITSINGQPVNSATALTNILDQHHPGENITVGLQNRTTNVTLATGPPG